MLTHNTFSNGFLFSLHTHTINHEHMAMNYQDLRGKDLMHRNKQKQIKDEKK